MRRLLFVATFLVAFFSTFMGGNTAQAQSMAKESYIPWQEADSTDYFNMTRCRICGEFVVCYDGESLDEAMDAHIDAMHNGDDSGGSLYPGGDYVGTGGSGGTGGSYDILYSEGVVSISTVASTLSVIGVCKSEWFVDECNAYCRCVVLDYAFIDDVDRVIKRVLGSKLRNDYSLKEARSYRRPFMYFAKPSGYKQIGNIRFYLYKVESSYNFYSFGNDVIEHYYVF